MGTPKKLHIRSSETFCCLCKNQYSAKYLIYVYRKDGLLEKINTLNSNLIKEDEQVQRKNICRNCLSKINNFWEFRLKCITKDKEWDKENIIVTKRGIFSPNQQQPNKKIHTDNYESSTNTKKKLLFIKKTTVTPPKADYNIFQEISNNCEYVCTRIKNKSVLHNHTYNGMGNFSFDQIFQELQTKNPVLIELFDAVTGKNGAVDNSTQVKYAVVYAILMNLRWHELSLFQRVISIIAIEGGCTTKVSMLL